MISAVGIVFNPRSVNIDAIQGRVIRLWLLFMYSDDALNSSSDGTHYVFADGKNILPP